MPSRSLFILGVIAMVAAFACWFALDARYRTVAQEDQEGDLVFPEFQDQLANLTSIEVARAGGTFALSRREGAWANMGIGGFPTMPTRVERAILAVAGLKYIAPKTARDDLYHKLEVEDMTATAKSTRLTFRDATGAAFADILIGKSKEIFGRNGAYVRFPGGSRTWLVDGSPDVRYDATGWSDRTVADFGADSLTALTVRKPDGEIVVLHRNSLEDRQLTLQNLPDGAIVEHQYQVDYMAELLQELKFTDARHSGKKPREDVPEFEVVVHWNRDLVAVLRVEEPMQDGSAWARIEARVNNELQASDLVKQEAARIQSTFGGWSIKLPRNLTDRIKIRLSDIIKTGVTVQ